MNILYSYFQDVTSPAVNLIPSSLPSDLNGLSVLNFSMSK